MARGRPKGDEPTCVLAVRVPIALREQLDRYLDALETRVGLKASRNEIIAVATLLGNSFEISIARSDVVADQSFAFPRR